MSATQISRQRLAIGLLLLFGSLFFVQDAAAQGRSYPNDGYYTAFGPFDDGDYATAADIFMNAGKGAIRGPGGRWIDSICYETMLGESYYRMGRYDLALERFNSALSLYLVQRNWLLRAELPPQVGVLQRTPRRPEAFTSWM